MKVNTIEIKKELNDIYTEILNENNLKYHNFFNGGEVNRVHLVACLTDYKFN